MTVDPFTDRLERVRVRFASTLANKIDDSRATIPQLSGASPEAAAIAAEVYRCVHGIVGVAPTVGFPTSGKAAREVEDVLRSPRQEKRGLSPEEVVRLSKALEALRAAAARIAVLQHNAILKQGGTV